MQDEDCQKVVSGLIGKQMVILGPNVALSTARKVSGLSIADDGTVTEMKGDQKKIMKAVIDEFVALSGQITNVMVESLIKE